MNMLVLWLNLRQPSMLGRYIKDSCTRVSMSFILSRRWMVHAKEISNKKLKFCYIWYKYNESYTYTVNSF